MRLLLALAAALGVALARGPNAAAQQGPPAAQVRSHPQLGEILVDARGDDPLRHNA